MSSIKNDSLRFTITNTLHQVTAQGEMNGRKAFKVFKGSQANGTARKLTTGDLARREVLILEGTLLLDSATGPYTFTSDHEFRSSSSAASIVMGFMTNGPKNWMTEQGETLRDYRASRT